MNIKQRFFLFFLVIYFSNICLGGSTDVFDFLTTTTSITKNKNNCKLISFRSDNLDFLVNKDLQQFELNIPTIDNNFISCKLTRFSVTSSDHNLIIQKKNSKKTENYQSNLNSYLINYLGEPIGVMIYFDNEIIFSYKYKGRQFEINKVENQFFLFDVNDTKLKNSFTCQVEEKRSEIIKGNNLYESLSSSPKCLELAIEIDHYTRNTFGSNISALNWAHAIIAGANQVYASEVNLNITVVNTVIWETVDPYANYVNSASSMLSALKNHWINNNSSVTRDLVHLMTKRTNTGTGGIAYRDVLCDNSWGYAFSANLNNNTNFSFPNPTYTWNLMVINHEIGHNIESHHTHWCGWPGGPIDNCVSVEGNCTNNINPQLGTIMSYCHTTSSGSIIDFHQLVVNNALNPGILGASCLTVCPFYGCTDSNATNYNPGATVDDGSCTYAPPQLSAIINNISCYGLNDGSIDLVVSGGLAPYTFIWSNGVFTEDINNLPSGTYTVTVTDALGQSIIASYVITEPIPITATYTATNTSGIGMSDGSISVVANGGISPYIYYWIGFSSTTSNLNNLSSGVYVSYILDNNGCFYVDSVEVSDYIPIALSLSYVVTDVSCNGESTGSIDLSVSGGSQPYTYQWSNGDISEDIFNLASNNYNVTVTDIQGQIISDSIFVDQVEEILISYLITNESNIGANDGSIDMSVSGGLQPYSFFWNTNPSQTTEDLINLSSGYYISHVGYDNWSCFVYDTAFVGLDVLGCTDSTALNYDPLATVDDSSCVFVVYGCTDSTALNYYLGANTDDGSCCYISGCTDITAMNYNANACVDDGSCAYSNNCLNPTPTGTHIIDILHTRARVKWDNMSSFSCIPEQYRVRYRESGSSASWSFKNAVNTSNCGPFNQTGRLLTNLSPATTYEYQVKAWYCNTTGSSVWSPLQIFTTLDACPNVGNFAVTTPLTTRAVFTWDDSNGPYSFVRIKLRVDSISNPSGSDWQNAGGFGVNYGAWTRNKNGLVAGETYRGQSRTWCDPNGGPYKSENWTSLIFWTQPTSVRMGEEYGISNLDVYPNPSRDIFNISFTSEEEQDFTLRVVNLLGEEIVKEDVQEHEGEYVKKINLNKYNKGIYLLEIQTKDGKINNKITLI